jgi:hypothetical protein
MSKEYKPSDQSSKKVDLDAHISSEKPIGHTGHTCNIDPHSQANNGLITKIWGGPTWITNHSITFGYPVEPDLVKKQQYKNYFMALGDVLPCKYCRDSYQKFITSGDTMLTDQDLESRETLTKWLYRVHEAVNHKLGVDYCVTYEEIVERYESFRARCGLTDAANQGCVTPLDYKAFSYKKLYQKDCPVIPYDLIHPFIKLAIIRKLDPAEFNFMEFASKFGGDISKMKTHQEWSDRNKKCQEIIQSMRENAQPSIESDGEWKGTPTIPELKLILRMSSNLNKTELRDAVCKLMYNQIYFQSLE